MADIFISYARENLEFAKRLIAELQKNSKDSWIDFKDIFAGQNFMEAIYEGISKANSFCFIVSRYSLSSEVCNLEVKQAVTQSKRILPLILERIEGEVFTAIEEMWASNPDWGDFARENWNLLSKLNWTFFDQDENFNSAIDHLVFQAGQDIDHLNQHTRLLVRAEEWQRSDRNTASLLFGKDIDVAESWLRASASKNPLPSQLHTAYIQASRASQRARRAASFVAIGAAIFAIGAIIFGGLTITQAEARFDSINLASEASQIARGQSATPYPAKAAARLALYALSKSYSSQADGALMESMPQIEESLYVLNGHRDDVTDIAWSPDGSRLASVSRDGTLRIWNIENGAVLRTFNAEPSGRMLRSVLWIDYGSWERDKDFILTNSALTGTNIWVWDLAVGGVVYNYSQHTKVIQELIQNSDRVIYSFGSDDWVWQQEPTDRNKSSYVERYVLQGFPISDIKFTETDSFSSTELNPFRIESTRLVYSDNSGALIRAFQGHREAILSFAISPDGSRLATASADNTIRLWYLSMDDEINFACRNLANPSGAVEDIPEALRLRFDIPPLTWSHICQA